MTLWERIKKYRWIILALIVGILIGRIFFSPPAQQMAADEHADHDHAEEPTTWTCSMHPQIRQDEPGQCPICAMDLVPVSTLDTGDAVDPDAIAMTESAAKLADVETMTVSRGSPQKELFLQGKVQADERNIAELTARFGGRIEKLFVSFTGETVNKGDKLATIYSPGLISAQRELLQAAELKESRPSLYKAAKAKLKLWDLNDEQIDAIIQEGEPQLYFDVLAPMAGTVTERHVAVGDYVEEGSALFQVVDLGRVWVLFDAYESDLPWIKTGDAIDFTIPSRPGKNYSANVTFVDPVIDPQTRTAQVRVELNNAQGDLKPEMFARGALQSEIAASSDKLLVPKTAVLWTGKRAVVYVKLQADAPTFRYREVVLGPEAGDFYVIEDGLEPGEDIAVNGVFKIDAAAQLQGKPSMMNPPKAEDHAGMDMQSEADQAVVVESIPDEFQQQLAAVYDAYKKLTEALVASDAAQASSHAAEVEQALQAVDMGLLEGDAHMAWMRQLETLEETIQTMAGTENLDEQRLAFSKFNLTFYKTVKTFGLPDETVYYQYCPMANRDTGAYWFSSNKEIRNPYFGDMMLKCGETRETIEPK